MSTTALVVAETGWLIERQLGPAAEARFYGSIANGDLTVEALTSTDWGRISEPGRTPKFWKNWLSTPP